MHIVMCMNLKRNIGLLWASLPTLVGLAYVGLMTLLGWYRFVERRDDCLIWTPRLVVCPGFLKAYWKQWGGHTVGNVIVVADPRDVGIIIHEQKHVEQYMRLGPLFIVFYLLGMLVAYLAGENYYLMNPLEIAARRHANEDVDPLS